MESTRIDKWLWAVRLYPTRSSAVDACQGGHVQVNGRSAKPSATVRVGDRIIARAHGRERMLEVATVIERRVGAQEAVTCYLDHTPPAPPPKLDLPMFVRDRAAGRPTKRDRRQLDRFRRS